MYAMSSLWAIHPIKIRILNKMTHTAYERSPKWNLKKPKQIILWQIPCVYHRLQYFWRKQSVDNIDSIKSTILKVWTNFMSNWRKWYHLSQWMLPSQGGWAQWGASITVKRMRTMIRQYTSKQKTSQVSIHQKSTKWWLKHARCHAHSNNDIWSQQSSCQAQTKMTIHGCYLQMRY